MGNVNVGQCCCCSSFVCRMLSRRQLLPGETFFLRHNKKISGLKNVFSFVIKLNYSIFIRFICKLKRQKIVNREVQKGHLTQMKNYFFHKYFHEISI